MKILNRYALREHLGPLCFALGALTSLLLLNYIAKNIGQLVGKGLPWSVIAEFVGLSVPFTVAMTMPMAVLVSVLYAFSRLAAENEITALKASGVSLSRLLIPVTLAAATLSVLMIAFNDQVLPRSNHQLRTLMEDIARKKPTFAIHAQVINEVSPGKLYLRAGRLDEASDRMREVVIYDLGDPSRRRTIFADSGTMALTAAGDLELTLYHGSMQEVQHADPGQLQRLYYDVNHVRIAGVGNNLSRSTNDTYKSEREMSICEMQYMLTQSEQSDAATQAEIEHALVNAVRMAARGTSVPSPLPPGAPGTPPFRARWGLGRVYCELIAPVVHPGVAHAQAAPHSPNLKYPHGSTPDQPPGVPSEHLASAGPPIRPVAVPPVAAATTLSVLTSTVDAARARIQDTRRTGNTYDVEIQKKFAIAVACMVFVLLGAPIALRFPRGGVGLVIGVSFGVFGLYYIGLIAGEPLAQNGTVSPFWAMWSSNFIFTVVGIFLLTRVGRAGSTARGGDWSEIREAMRGIVGRIRHPLRGKSRVLRPGGIA